MPKRKEFKPPVGNQIRLTKDAVAGLRSIQAIRRDRRPQPGKTRGGGIGGK